MHLWKSVLQILMPKRVTVVISDELDKKIRNLQAKMIQSSTSNVSYSGVINEILKKELKK